MDDDHIKAIANQMSSSMDAYQKGKRIDDSMTFEEARWLNLGRKMHEAIRGARPVESKVIPASNRFPGGAR